MFMYRGRNKRVRMATSFANQLMQNHAKFFDVIKNAEQFMDTEVANEDILLFMQDRFMNCIQEIKVSRRYNPFGSAIASFNPRRPNEIRLNAWKLKRSADSICGSLCHEFVHLTDFFYKTASFGHAYQDHPGRELTAPYRIGELAKQHCIKYFD